MITLGIRRRFLLAEQARLRAKWMKGQSFDDVYKTTRKEPFKFRFRDAPDDFNWRILRAVQYTQAFLSTELKASVSVCINEQGASLIIGCTSEGVMSPRMEYPIPAADAYQLLSQCQGPKIERLARRFCYGSHFWQIDEYMGDNLGLVIAEVELNDGQIDIELPHWIGQEITGDQSYDNEQLLAYPFASRRHSVLQPTPLLPCPFCGCASSVHLTDTARENLLDPQAWVFRLVRCQSHGHHGGCGAQGPWADDVDEAVVLWNHRTHLRALATQHFKDDLAQHNDMVRINEAGSPLFRK